MADTATPPAPNTAPTPTRGYSATKDQLAQRLARIEGQVRGIERRVDDERYCIDIITQISAIQAALDKVALGLLDDMRAPASSTLPRASKPSAPRS